MRWARSAGLSQIHPHRIACAKAARSTTWTRASVPGRQRPAAQSRRNGAASRRWRRSSPASHRRRRCAEVRVEVAVEHGAGLADRGRRPPGRGDREPRLEQLPHRRTHADARSAWAAATIAASSRSASARLPRTVTERSMRRPVLGRRPMNTRSSQEPWIVDGAIPACPIIGTPSARNRSKSVGKAVGTVGRQRDSAAPKRAAELERTTGFEPATLTLAKVMGFVRAESAPVR